MRFFFYLLAGLMWQSYAEAAPASGGGQLAKLEQAFRALRIQRTLPPLISSEDNSIDVSSKPVPKDVQKIFDQVQKFAFGRTDLISLKACKECEAVADAASMSVYVDPEFLESLGESQGSGREKLNAFVVAHEISHFILEYMTILGGGLSPNGNIPLMTKSFGDFVDLVKFSGLSTEEQNAESAKYMELVGPSHGEVDVLALFILNELGFDCAEQALKFLRHEISLLSPGSIPSIEFGHRLKAVSGAFPVAGAGR